MVFRCLYTVEIRTSSATGEVEKLGLKLSNGAVNKTSFKHPTLNGLSMEREQDNSEDTRTSNSLEFMMQDIWSP